MHGLSCSTLHVLCGCVLCSTVLNYVYSYSGIKDIDVSQRVKDDFCKLCNGTCNTTDMYAGHEGAFKCMAAGTNDRVGFVKQGTANKTFKANPGQYGESGDYKLLCKNGQTAGASYIMECGENKLSKDI